MGYHLIARKCGHLFVYAYLWYMLACLCMWTVYQVLCIALCWVICWVIFTRLRIPCENIKSLIWSPLEVDSRYLSFHNSFEYTYLKGGRNNEKAYYILKTICPNEKVEGYCVRNLFRGALACFFSPGYKRIIKKARLIYEFRIF